MNRLTSDNNGNIRSSGLGGHNSSTGSSRSYRNRFDYARLGARTEPSADDMDAGSVTEACFVVSESTDKDDFGPDAVL